MKISKNLPNFLLKTGFFIITSKFEVEFYIAKEGQIEKIDEFEVEKPGYLDREGFFETGGTGGMKNGKGISTVYKSGAVYEDKDKKVRKDLISELNKRLPKVLKQHKVNSIYLYSPDYMLGNIEESLPKRIASKIDKRFKVNYIKEHPFKILKKLDSEIGETFKNKKGKPKTEEERKILAKSGKDNIYE
ncbi:MAG: hypothetical protein GF335_05170 [Candidatus Moranbacteria bacterium]|nr:hypothetical protein [Candidatus Moranbacteria bacterium]